MGNSFALFRLPGATSCTLVEQTSSTLLSVHSVADLYGYEGFVIAPFAVDSAHPMVIIPPDKVTHYAMPSTPEALPPLPVLDSAEARAQYLAKFPTFSAPLREGTLQKVVLSRRCSYKLQAEASLRLAFHRASVRYPHLMVYLCYTPLTGAWLGSTPELLLSGKGTEWQTMALAGTMNVDESDVAPAWSGKDCEEQQYVAQYIRRVLLHHGSDVAEVGPYTVRAAHLAHLRTDFSFTMPPTHIGALLQELHPTPAVCGVPKEQALSFIKAHEGYNRGYYTGFVGYISATKQTQLFVNLRCAELNAQTATLYAGSGLLASSVAEAEWQETCEKMKTILQCIPINEAYYNW